MLKSPIVPSSTTPGGPREFIGRDEDIPILARAFEAGQHVVLWGVGGIGKTALAQHMMQRQAWRFGDGVVFHSCEASPLLDSFLSTLAPQLSFVPTGQGLAPAERRAAVSASFRSKRCLLVVDNFETVSEPDSFLAFIDGLPTGSVALITTREAVRVRGWLVHELHPLPDAESVRLLASLLTPELFARQSERAVQALLQQVGGHPMAI